MVSSRHEAMHRIFRHDPGVFARAFRALDLPFPDPVAVDLMPTDRTEIQPVERRVDSMLRVETVDGPFLLLVEAQGQDDPDKPAAWAYYVAHAHSKYRLPVVLLIVCHDRVTALWAVRPAAIGLPLWPSLTVQPMVLGPHNVPVVTDAAAAAGDLPLATLSAVTHAKDPRIGEILTALATALRDVDDDEDRAILAELTELGLGSTRAATIWRQLMTVDMAFFRSETSQRLRAQGREEGRTEGIANSILRILDHRGIPLSPEARDRIATCSDTALLETWLDRAVAAPTADAVFANTP
ncbi:hypothetical protein BJY24_006179 [Nocardia transvalensis]|uniref:Uncharacterized protein n=1 Tax=Nocardia transvalensis TaxID=37333 RepID=A0A7W9ULE0_9NOCA|nr:hypothetical protein [Nocardia transvalensis]MBB5917267.1 hypothetical protein [Nocardia transvalensis]